MTVETYDKRIITPVCRLSFPHLFKPAKPMSEDQEPKFQADLIFEEGADLSAIENAVQQAIFDKWGSKPPKKLRLPLRPGTDRDSQGYEDNSTFLTARSKDRPGVVKGPNRDIVTDPLDVYGGCFVVASITAFAYDAGGNRGASFALNNIWKVRDGDSFGNRKSPEQDFAEAEVDADAFGEETAESLL